MGLSWALATRSSCDFVRIWDGPWRSTQTVQGPLRISLLHGTATMSDKHMATIRIMFSEYSYRHYYL